MTQKEIKKNIRVTPNKILFKISQRIAKENANYLGTKQGFSGPLIKNKKPIDFFGKKWYFNTSGVDIIFIPDLKNVILIELVKRVSKVKK